MKLGEEIASGLKQIIDLRRSHGDSVAWEAMLPVFASYIEKRLTRGCSDALQCPICSQPSKDERYPEFFYANRSSQTAKEPRWLLNGCAHMKQLGFGGVLALEDIDRFNEAWKQEVPKLFAKQTENWTPEQRAVRAQALELSLP